MLMLLARVHTVMLRSTWLFGNRCGGGGILYNDLWGFRQIHGAMEPVEFLKELQ